MKKYFDFTLKGGTLFFYWIIIMVALLVPLIVLGTMVQNYDMQGSNPNYPLLIVCYLALILISLFVNFYLIKLQIQNTLYDGEAFVFTAKFKEYITLVLLGTFLSIITLGIYIPWFEANLLRFYAEKTTLKDTEFAFKGKGGKLFVITLLSYILPLALFFAIIGGFTLFSSNHQPSTIAIFFAILVMFFSIIALAYLANKWRIDIQYKNYHFTWKTDFFKASGKILLEVFLSIITFYIYAPLAMIHLYKYFTNRTVGENSEGALLQLGYDANQGKDFLYIWGQILLSLITVGIFYPWALCHITKRFYTKTYIMTEDEK